MVSTEVLVIIAVVVGVGLMAIIAFLVFCVRRAPRQQEEYSLLLSEKGSVMPRVNPEVERHHKMEQAMMNARFYIRASTFMLDKYLPDIGHRGQKQYFMVSRARTDFIMSMTRKTDKWPIPLASDVARTTYNRILKSLEGHPNVSVPVECDYMVEKDIAVAIRPYYSKGSLKDYIHKAKPQQKHAEKYHNNYGLNPKLIGKFGRQILEGLNFLKFQGFPYYQLHSGNVLVDENSCSISEMENSLIGAPPYLAPFMKHLMDKVDPDIVCFGCVLFEMAIGYELESPESYQLGVPSTCPEEVKKILDAIFNPWFGTPPTVEELLKLSLFSDVKLKKIDYQRVQHSSKERDMIASVKKCIVSVITDTPINTSEFQKKKKAKNFTSFSNPSSSIPPLAPSLSSATLPPLTPNSPVGPSAAPAASSQTPPPPSSGSSKAPPPPPPPPSGKVPPPPPPPSGKAPPPPPPPSAGKSALLDSISGFKGGLKKTVTVDKSAPKVGKAR